MTVSSPRPTTYVIDALKITRYLLDLQSKRGASKAKFFLGWGFDRNDPGGFTVAIVSHAKCSPLVDVVQTPYGQTLVYEGPVQSPNGATPSIYSVWQIATGSAEARLITAYPV